uniref:J domain-containing protein n=1 Tax=Alexandrium catenella TaxID=2925 RepID=A0A7S1WF97_ALECA|mmetsp:Transcript_56601/g.151560  ORF Transcript_56601/g.151560 Transcript_56601/m.151560 type:complete len:103 (+) Transcript_56601:2-310(+)
MHPDKNGGTDEAKERFQEMKELYEALKERRRSGKDRPRPEPEPTAPPSDDGARITYDPADRGSMGGATSRMLHELRTLHQHYTVLRTGLQGCKRPAGHQGGS